MIKQSNIKRIIYILFTTVIKDVDYRGTRRRHKLRGYKFRCQDGAVNIHQSGRNLRPVNATQILKQNLYNDKG